MFFLGEKKFCFDDANDESSRASGSAKSQMILKPATKTFIIKLLFNKTLLKIVAEFIVTRMSNNPHS
jgi:hypothetical protein